MEKVCKLALCLAANERMGGMGIGHYPPRRAPEITRKHIDGPYLSALDGQIVWLTPWERLLTKLGVWDAWDIEWRRFPLTAKDQKHDQ